MRRKTLEKLVRRQIGINALKGEPPDEAKSERIDDRLASAYINRHTAGTHLAQLLLMAEEARANEALKDSAIILDDAARRMAEWEIDNE